jgi:uncharacterized membrane protein YjfL (UPF0719 family)
MLALTVAMIGVFIAYELTDSLVWTGVTVVIALIAMGVATLLMPLVRRRKS